MSRRLFISFLGTIDYGETRYVGDVTEEADAIPLRFVQEATIRKYCVNYTSGDAILIFTTDGALVNWKNSVDNRGLKIRLSNLNLKAKIENIMIPDGKSTQEIWQIFEIIFSQIHHGDHLIFDITHGFRSLPMLNMVLINYAKLLKDVTIKGIYYGAYEARYRREEIEYSPVWNLSDFEVLQEWTNRASIFLKTGNALPLSSLMEDIDDVKDLGQNLESFSKFIMSNRGVDIFEGSVMVALRSNLKQFNKGKVTNHPALLPITKKIENEFDHYEVESIWNGFIAVHWCIRNGLVQQAATLLEEFIISYVLVEIGQKNYLKNPEIRTTVSSALTIGKNVDFQFILNDVSEVNDEIIGIQEWQRAYVKKIRELPYKSTLGNILSRIKESVRNDLNHGGFRSHPRNFDDLQGSVIKRYKEVRTLFGNLHPDISLPVL